MNVLNTVMVKRRRIVPTLLVGYKISTEFVKIGTPPEMVKWSFISLAGKENPYFQTISFLHIIVINQ